MTFNTHETKQAIKDAIDSINDNKTLLQIQNYVFKDRLRTLIQSSLTNKLGATNGHDEHLFSLMSNDHNHYTKKEQLFQEVINSGGVFDGEEILKYQHANLYHNIISPSNSLLYSHANSIARMNGNMGYNSGSVGPSEFLMALFGKGITFASKGDLDIHGEKIEVKATIKSKSKSNSGGRFCGTSGFGAPSAIREELHNFLVSLGVDRDDLNQYRKGGIKGGINLNNSGLENLNYLIAKYLDRSRAGQMYEFIIRQLYPLVTNELINKFMECINEHGTQDFLTIQKELAKLAFDYYKMTEHHDAVMFVNVDTGNYGMATCRENLDKFFDIGKLQLTSHIDWNDDRGRGSAQLLFT